MDRGLSGPSTISGPHRSRTWPALVLLLLLVPGQVLSAVSVPRIGSVDVSGTGELSPAAMTSWLSGFLQQPYDSLRREQIIATIRERCRAMGYYRADATIGVERTGADDPVVHLRVVVKEGKPATVEEVRFDGVRAFDPAMLRQVMDTRPGSVLLAPILEADIGALLDLYERTGYALAACRVEAVRLSTGEGTDLATVTLAIDEGPLMTIDEVRVEGNRETRPGVILREARVTPGEPFHPERVEAIRSRLARLNIFARVFEPELYMAGTRGGLLLRVEEGKTNTFDGIAGYVPSSIPGESGTFTGMVTIGMRNLFGTGRRMNLRWQKEDRFSQDLAVGYMEPWVGGWPVNAGIEFQQRRQDSTYVRQAGTLRLEMLATGALAVSVLATAEGVIPSSDTLSRRVPGSSSLGAGAEVVYDTRDDLYSPREGARYRADFGYARKRIAGSAVAAATAADVRRFGLDLDLYVSPFLRQVIAIGLHGRQVQGGGVDESQMVRFGGANTLRGYRENQFLGSRVAWTACEYRLLLARRSYVYGFFDTGYYFRPGDAGQNTPSTEAFHYGYGLGLRFETPLGIMAVSFALGRGDSFAQGKIHVGVVGDF